MEPGDKPETTDEAPELKEQPRGSSANHGGAESASATTAESSNFWFYVIVFVAVAVIVVVLSVTLTGRDEEEEELPDETPTAVDYSTGVSLVTYYGIETVIRSRLARTTLTLEVANALACSSIHSITLQLPRAARVASLETITDECTTHGEVQELKEARETFLEAAAQGLPGAYIEEQDSFTHGIQVAIPPLGKTQVRLVLEELLSQRLGKVAFQAPLAPNEEIDQIEFDLTVEDLTGGMVGFHLDLPDDIIEKGRNPEDESLVVDVVNNTAGDTTAEEENAGTSMGLTRFHLDIPDARQHELPKVVAGWYHPREIPETGLLATDGLCFEHFFLPPSAEPMPKNIAFLFNDAINSSRLGVRAGLSNFINTLMPQDKISIQVFGRRGTVDRWGPSLATAAGKEEARLFIDSIVTASSGNDIQEAFLEALLRARTDAENSSDNTATVLVALSSSRASLGEIDPGKIARNIYRLNEDGKVKIFTMAFPGADNQLLDAISLTNGGVSTSIRGTDQTMKVFDFLRNELGSILLSDVRVTVAGDGLQTFGETQHVFPLLADGSEVIVRGLVESDGSATAGGLRALTSAATFDGNRDWIVQATSDFYPTPAIGDAVSLCFQSYAHERITQLLRLRDAAKFMESGVIAGIVNLIDETCDLEDELPECIEAEALALAIDAKIVVKGLTAMVTVDDQQCLSFEGENEICLDGTTPDGTTHDDTTPDGTFAAESTDTPKVASGNNEEWGYGDWSGGNSKGASAFLSFVSACFWLLLACVSW